MQYQGSTVSYDFAILVANKSYILRSNNVVSVCRLSIRGRIG